MWTVERIKELLNLNDTMVCRSVCQIYQRQTAGERASKETSEQNGIGFNGIDAPLLSSFAEQYTARGFLTPKQIAIARRKMIKYAKQLTKIANGEI